jgi:hypothetical protein
MVRKSTTFGLAFTALFAAVSLFAGIPEDGIVAQFMFTGNIADSSGNNNKATSSAITLSPDRFGKENCSYWFNGASSYILVDSAKGLPSGNHAKSISLWFKSGSISSVSLMILAGFGSRAPTNGASFQIGHYDGWRINGYGDSYDWRTKILQPDYLDTQWHHCVVTYDGMVTKVYFDGTLKASTSAFQYTTVAERIIIGMEIDLAGWNFEGYLDDIIFYDRAISESEVTEIYHADGYIDIIDLPYSYDRRPEFIWHPVSGVSTYTIVIDTVAAFAKPIFFVDVSDTTFTPTADLPLDTIYWKVITDNNGASRTSVCIIQEPGVPIIIPFNPEIMSMRRPVFRWHPVSGAASYTIVVDTNQRFPDPILVVPVRDTSYQPQVDLPEDTMFWKVKSDLISTFSSVSRLIIKADSFPVLYRFNGAYCSYQPTFRWKSMEKGTTYWIQIDTVHTFLAPYISLPLSDTSYTPATRLSERPYFWRASSSKDFSLFAPMDSLIVRRIVDIAPYSSEVDQPAPFHSGLSCRNGTLFLSVPRLSRSGMVSVYDLQGKKIGSWEVPATVGKGALARFPLHTRHSNGPGKGLYLVKVRFGKETASNVIPVWD